MCEHAVDTYHFPAVCSIRIAIILSTDPNMARCIITGFCIAPLSSVNFRSNLTPGKVVGRGVGREGRERLAVSTKSYKGEREVQEARDEDISEGTGRVYLIGSWKSSWIVAH